MFGRITRVELRKGFGFIRANGIDCDYFFHFSELIEFPFSERLVGERVEFDPVLRDKGLAAERVRPVRFEPYLTRKEF
jgi:cold shock CspA family protein